MEEIVRLLKRYEKAKLRFENSKERDMPSLAGDEISRDAALLALERAVNSYIDDRVQFILKGCYPWIFDK